MQLEGQAEHLAGVGIVVHDQDPCPVEHRRYSAPGSAGGCLGRGSIRARGPNREPDPENGSEPLAGTRGLHGPAVQLDDVAHDGQAQPEAAVRAFGRTVGLAKALENVRQKTRGDPLSGVRDGDLHLRFDALEANLNPPRARRELQRVRQQVPYHLPETARIGVDAPNPTAEVHDQLDPLRLRRRPYGIDSGFDGRSQLDRPNAQPEPARDDARYVEEIVDDLSLGHGAALDRLEGAGAVVRGELSVAEQLGPPEDGVERRAQLVRHRRQELVFQAVGGLSMESRHLGFPPRLLLAGEDLLAFPLGLVSLRDDGGEQESRAADDGHEDLEQDQAFVGGPDGERAGAAECARDGDDR